MNSYADFIRGRFQGISLSRDGRLSLAPRLETLFSTDQPIVWSVGAGPDGILYAATGHRGRVYRSTAPGKRQLFWTCRRAGSLRPRRGARRRRSTPARRPTARCTASRTARPRSTSRPGARYIWSLAAAADGALYVGTGDQGKVFRVDGGRQGDPLVRDRASRTSPAWPSMRKAACWRAPSLTASSTASTRKDKAFVLYDSSLPEIRAIVPMPDGTIYAAALGGSVAKRMQSAARPAQGGAGGGCRHRPAHHHHGGRAEHAAGAEIKPPDPAKQHQAAAAAAPQVSTQFTPVVDMTRRREVRRLPHQPGQHRRDALEFEGGKRLRPARAGKATAVRHRPERPHLRARAGPPRDPGGPDQRGGDHAPAAGEKAVLAATGNMGRIYRLDESRRRGGLYEAPVHDAGTAARWGSLSWRADAPRGLLGPLPHPLRQFGQAGPHLERVVGAPHRCRRFAHHQPQRALHRSGRWR